MNRLVIVWITLGCAVVGAKSVSDDVLNAPRLSEAHIEKLAHFLASFSAIVPPEVERGQWGKHGALPTIALKFPHPNKERAVYVDVDARDGTVYFFMSSAPYDEKSDHDEPMEELMGAREAFQRSVALLAHLGLSTEMTDYQVAPDAGLPSNRAQGCWLIRKELTLDGIECYKAWIEIYIRVSTKQIEVVSYRPPIPPRPVESRISKDEARARVSQWIKTDREFSRCPLVCVGEAQDIREIIVIPPEHKKMRTIPEEPFQSSYCWYVPVTVDMTETHVRRGQFGTVPIPVEMDTGRILIEIPNPDSH